MRRTWIKLDDQSVNQSRRTHEPAKEFQNVMRSLDLLRHLTALHVEDDPEQREAMGDLLRIFFNEVVTAANGVEALQLYRTRPIQFVIADLKMPGMNGLELAEAIRRLDRRVPILLMSAFTETADLLAATRLNLVDYLVKPLAWETLKACLERSARDLTTEGHLFVRLDAETTYSLADGSLWRAGVTIDLTTRERALFDVLVMHRDGWLTKDQLLSELFTDFDQGSEAALKNLLVRLRRKLGTEAIINRYGIGYRLNQCQDT